MGNGKVTDAVKPCKKTFGVVVASVARTDPSKKKGKTGKPLKNVSFTLVETGAVKKSGGSGSAEFSSLPPKTYTVNAKLADDQKNEFELVPVSRSVVLPPKGKVKAEFKAARLAAAKVHVTGSGANRAGVHVQITGPKTATVDTSAQGIADFGTVPIGDYTVAITFTADDANDKEFTAPTAAPTFTLVRGDDVTKDVALVPNVPLKVKVLRNQPDVLNIHQAHVDLTGPKNVSADTGPDGTVDFGKLPPGAYQATVTFVNGDANDLAHYAPLAPSALNLVSGSQPVLHEVPVESKTLTVNVVRKNPDKKLANIGVKVGTVTADTDVNGAAVCHSLANGPNPVTLELRGNDAKDYELPALQTVTVARGGTRSITIELVPKKCEVHLTLAIKLPDDSAHALPKDLAVTLRASNGTTVVGKLDDKGVVVDSGGNVPVMERALKFSLEFPAAANSWLVFEKAGAGATQELLVDADPKFGSPLALKTAAGSRALLWVQADAKLIEIDAEAAPADHFTKPDFAFKDEITIGTASAPVKVSLKPKWQYLRFEYFDRKYGKADHGGKRISVPPVLLKASRKTTDGTLQNLAAGGNLVVDPTDDAKACHALAWIVTKKVADGADLPKLDKSTYVQFGEAQAWVEAKSKTEREYVKLDAAGTDKDKLKPGKDRSKYYDLPELWTNCFQLTRIPGPKVKFFDELTDVEIEASYDKTKPLTFSLDDIVLVDNAGAQTVQDKGKTGTAKDLAEHSRLAILHLDPDDKYNVKVWEPFDDAVYHSKKAFVKDAADTYRNVLAEYPNNARAVLFCNGIYHVYDKRTSTVTYAKKHIKGARAAKLDDADAGTTKRVLDQNADAYADLNFTPVVGGSGFVHMPRQFHLYYIHNAEADDKTVYGILLTLYGTRFFGSADMPGGSGPWKRTNGSVKPLTSDVADIRNYRNPGLKDAMARWNKGYFLEQNDDKADYVIKPYCLFEAKDPEKPDGTFNEYGGPHDCICAVSNDTGEGSSANAKQMYMRQDAYGCADSRAPLAGDPPIADYDGTTAAQRNAFAHELGHAAVGLFDDYITQTLSLADVPTYDKPQRYPGVPYNFDPVSIMNMNRAVRLRSIWGRVLYVNKEADGGALEKFLDKKVFRAAYAPTGKDKLKYYMPGGKSIYKPVQEGVDVGLGEQGKINLYLYELGEDEFLRWMQNGPYDAMLILNWKLCTTFVDVPDPGPWVATQAYAVGDTAEDSGQAYRCKTGHTSGATFVATNWEPITPKTWDDDAKKDWIEDVDKRIHQALEGDTLEGKFKLTSGGKYKKVFVRAFPEWSHKDTPATADPAGTHFTFVVTGDGTDTMKTTLAKVEVGESATVIPMLRYILGRYTAVVDKTTKIALADLPKLSEWIKTNTGNSDDYASDDVALSISQVAPAGGAPEGGDVTITGTNLSDVVKVMFGAVEQNTFTKTSTSLTAKVPANAVTAKVTLSTNNRSQSTPSNFKVLPAITSLEPATPVAVDAEVTIHGTTLANASALKFGTVAATIATKAATKITAKVPQGAVTAKVEVTTPDGTAMSPANLTVIPPPTISDFSPKSAKVGAAVTISGAELAGATAVKIGGVAATVTRSEAGTIVATVGGGAASGNVEVVTPGGTVTKDGYTLAT